MIDREAPDGARPAARVLVFDASRRLLMLEAHDAVSRWWVAPGGGLVGDLSEHRYPVRPIDCGA